MMQEISRETQVRLFLTHLNGGTYLTKDFEEVLKEVRKKVGANPMQVFEIMDSFFRIHREDLLVKFEVSSIGEVKNGYFKAIKYYV